MYADDTIAAVATPPGVGGIGIIRVSGPLCQHIAATVFVGPAGGPAWNSHHLYHGRLVDGSGQVLDAGLAVLMRRPRSYTGEDVLELHCHGSPGILQRVLARVLRCGARLAEPGEFTKRAFLNGRLDLAQAEAVVHLITARTGAAAALAMDQLCGRLSEGLATLRMQLVGVKALLEAKIDFSEEDFEVAPAEVFSAVDTCTESLQCLIDTYRHGKLLRDGLRVAIIGKPNVGKSSLLNALLGEDRAIVTAISGTTRDTIDEAIDLDGIPIMLSDTAGLRDPDQADPIERIGMERTAAKIAEADLLLKVLDVSQSLDAADTAVLADTPEKPQIIVLNKIDLEKTVQTQDILSAVGPQRIVEISAMGRLGLPDLRTAIAALARGDDRRESAGPVLVNVRHCTALKNARDSLLLARRSLTNGEPPDVIAVDIQDALDHVGTVTGVITNEDVLDKIFSEFCIGK